MRLFVPSWQQPGSWLQNIERLVQVAWIQGIELLLFDGSPQSVQELSVELEAIAAFSDRFDFTLHLPDPLGKMVTNLVDATSHIVESYVFHPFDASKEIQSLNDWAKTLDRLFSIHGKERFVMEYTGREKFERSGKLLGNIAICADTGCLLREGIDPADWVLLKRQWIKEIHVHGAGVDSKDSLLKDHRALEKSDTWVIPILDAAKSENWIIDIETFSLEESTRSHVSLVQWL
jgi:hypothetical protein